MRRHFMIVLYPSRVLKPLLISDRRVEFLLNFIQRTVSKQMPVFIAFSASERDVFIVKRLDPVTIFMGETNHVRKSLSNVHEDTNSGVRGEFIYSCLIRRPNKISKSISNLLKGGFIPIVLRKRKHVNPDRGPREILIFLAKAVNPVPEV